MPPYFTVSLFAERLAVGALVLSGCSLVGAHQNALQRAEVCILAMVGALLDSTLNALVCVATHRDLLLIFVINIEYPECAKTYISASLEIDFFPESQYNICGICDFRKFVL